MKVAALMITLDRKDVTPATTERNVKIAGIPIDHFVITDNGSRDGVQDWARNYANHFIQSPENWGVAKAFNKMLQVVQHYDLVCIMGNDIEMPQGWLSTASYFLSNPDVGLVGFSWRGYDNPKEMFMGEKVVFEDKIFGTWVTTGKVLQQIGYMKEYSKYGMEDSDYNVRLDFAGFRRLYAVGHESHHIINDVGQKTVYRKQKDENLSIAAQQYFDQIAKYSPDCYHIDKNQKLRCAPKILHG